MVSNLVRELLAIVGLGMIGWGCWIIYPPVAGIVVGAFLLGSAIWGHYHAAKEPLRESGSSGDPE